MTPLYLHIEYLLQRHDCVILPGMGAFIAEHHPACFDEESQIFLAPSTGISFNPAINHNDGMLATSISRREMVKFEEAKTILLSEIARIREILASEGEYPMGKVGTLTIDGSGNLGFLPPLPKLAASEAGRPSIDISGLTGYVMQSPAPSGSLKELSPFVSDSLKPKDSPAVTAVIGDIGVHETLADANVQPATPAQKPGMVMRPFSEKNYYIAINKVFAKCAASVALLLIVAVSFLIPNTRNFREPVKASLNPVESLVNISSQATKPHPAEDAAMTASSPVHEMPGEPAAEITSPQEGSYLIVATFHNESEARDFMRARSGGNYTLSLLKGKNVWRVSAAHGDMAAMKAILNSSEFRAAFSEAWIWNAR